MTDTAKHTILFKVWIHIRGFIAVVIVLFGILIGLTSLILPNENLYKPYLQQVLKTQWNKTVEIGQINGKWHGFGPRFKVLDLLIKDDDEVKVESATLDINIYQLLIPGGKTGINLTVDEASINIERQSTGAIVVTNLNQNEIDSSFSDRLDSILSAGTFSVNNLSLDLYDAIHNRQNKINSKIIVQQDLTKRAFELSLLSEGLADELMIKAVTKKNLNFLTQAQWYLQSKSLSVSKLGELINKSFLPNTIIDSQVWFNTENGNITHLIGTAKLGDKLLNENYDITGAAELVYKGVNNNWQAHLELSDIQTKSIKQEKINIDLKRKDNSISIQADILDVQLLKSITQTFGINLETFYQTNISGKLTNVSINYDYELRRIVEAQIQFERLDLVSELGFFNNLKGELSLIDEQIRILIDSEQGEAQVNSMMRGSVKWNQLNINAQTSMQDDDLDIKVNSFWCDCIDIKLDGSARIRQTDQLHLNLAFKLADIQINQLYKYWPANVWKQKILNFLDEALIKGEVKQAWIVYSGFTNEYPFKKNQGVFHARAMMHETEINYHNDWPNVVNFNAQADFINRSMLIESNQGRVMLAELDDVKAEIKNFKKPHLTIDLKAHGQDNYLIDFLNKSPMKNDLEILNQDIKILGSQSIALNFEMPLENNNIKFEPKGKIRFHDSKFSLAQFSLDNLSGTIDFEGFSLKMNHLTSSFFDQNVIIKGNVYNHPGEKLTVDLYLDGNYQIQNFENILGFTLPAKGQSLWQFEISNKNSNELQFIAKSNLNGVQIDMPDPISKTIEQTTPIAIQCILPCLDGSWDINFDEKIKANIGINETTKTVELSKLIFGNSLQTSDNFGGNIEYLDVDKWLSLLPKSETNSSKTTLPFENMQLSLAKMKFMDRILENVNLEIDVLKDDLIFKIDGQHIKGEVTIGNNINQSGVLVQLEKLHWLASPIQEQDNASTQAPTYPPLHVWIEDFIYDGIPLGETRLEVRPVVNGIKVEKFTTKSELMNLNIDGIWLKDQGPKGLSKFNIIMSSEDIAQFLASIGFQAPISKADTIIDMKVEWQDSPGAFEFNNISGELRIEIGKGEVIDADPGMGRVLGLFSLTNLPRRLLLDFKDVFAQGLLFNSMIGDFKLVDGDAFTNNFSIDSASAKITVTGKTGLANRDYDQIVIVSPRVGRVLPTIGAITGGAVGAAAGFLVQGLFRKGLKNVGQIQYKVTGSWDEPKIELIETIENKDS